MVPAPRPALAALALLLLPGCMFELPPPVTAEAGLDGGDGDGQGGYDGGDTTGGTPDSGTPPSCRVISNFTIKSTQVGYDLFVADGDSEVWGIQDDFVPPATGRRIEVQVWGSYPETPNSPVLPMTREFSPAYTDDICDGCLFVGEGCFNADDCLTWFYPVSGTMTVTRADRTNPPGAVIASGSDIRLREWKYDEVNDTSALVPGGGCLDLPSFQMDVRP